MASEFRLLMISAMYENGGNTTQRLLDGHPELISYLRYVAAREHRPVAMQLEIILKEYRARQEANERKR